MKSFRLTMGGLGLAMLLCAAPAAAELDKPTEKQWEAFEERDVKVDAMDPAKSVEAIEAAVKENKEKFFEATYLILQAQYEHKARSTKAAEEHLKKAAADDHSVFFDAPPMGAGVAKATPEAHDAISGAMTKRYRDTPFAASDVALLELYRLQIDANKPVDAAKTAKQLIEKYPQGDHAKEDRDLLDALHKQYNWFPGRLRLFNQGLGGEFAAYINQMVRPHMRILMLRADAALLGQANVTPSEGAEAVVQLLTLYDFLLRDDRCNEYATLAQRMFNGIDETSWKGKIPYADAAKFFEQAADKYPEPKEP